MSVPIEALSADSRALPALHRLLWRWAPKHPVRMTAVFDHCWLLNYRMPPPVLAARLPDGIEPALHGGEAWLSVVVAAMSGMRPVLAPRPFAVRFDQVVYRAVVTHRGEHGVAFLRTDANHRLYAWAGDLLTYFHFHHSPIAIDATDGGATLRVDAPGADIRVALDHGADPERCDGSVFGTVAEAKPWLVDRYHAFHVHPRTGRFGRVTVDRAPWQVRAVGVRDAHLAWLDRALPGSILDSALYAPSIPYVWSAARPA